MQERFMEFRTKWAVLWVLCNIVFAYVLNELNKESLEEEEENQETDYKKEIP